MREPSTYEGGNFKKMCIQRITLGRRFEHHTTTDGNHASRLHDLSVPCNKCYQCLINKANEWAFRVTEEAKKGISSYFVTLTYKPERLPTSTNGFATLIREHFTNYIKRLRYYDCDNTALKFFGCGEYGSAYGRPHYHLCAINIIDPENFARAWQENGHIHIGTLNSKSAKYTAKYMCKHGQVPKHKRDDREKEFHYMSKGLGLSYVNNPSVLKYHHSDYKKLKVKLDNKWVYMPRYIREKIWENPTTRYNQTIFMLEELRKEEEKQRKIVRKYYGDKISYENYKKLIHNKNRIHKFKLNRYVRNTF